uniref:Uncharacterized protein n=1 Tax=Anguilla anguilla TaxID=7936 RepID=A0A0E9SCC9_ANGAN
MKTSGSGEKDRHTVLITTDRGMDLRFTLVQMWCLCCAYLAV